MEVYAMGREEISVTIDAEGKIQIAVSGFDGLSCLDATASLEKRLGGNITERQLSDAAFDSNANTQNQWQGGKW